MGILWAHTGAIGCIGLRFGQEFTAEFRRSQIVTRSQPLVLHVWEWPPNSEDNLTGIVMAHALEQLAGMHFLACTRHTCMQHPCSTPWLYACVYEIIQCLRWCGELGSSSPLDLATLEELLTSQAQCLSTLLITFSPAKNQAKCLNECLSILIVTSSAFAETWFFAWASYKKGRSGQSVKSFYTTLRANINKTLECANTSRTQHIRFVTG